MIENILIILLVNLLFFYRTLKLGYCSDDIPVFQKPPPFKNKWHKRFLQLIAANRLNKKEDHALTTVLHAVTAVFVYLALGANEISFLAAILFSFNPANNQGSIWISGRGYVLTTLLLLMAMTFKFVAPLFIYFAMTYPCGFFAPLAYLGSPNWWLVLCVPIFWFLHFKRLKSFIKPKMKVEAVTEDKRIHIGRLVVAIKTYAFYAILCIFPHKLTFYHSFLQSAGGNEIMRKRAYKKDWLFLAGLALLGYMIYSLWHWTPISWGVLWYSICIAPYANLVRLQQEIAERYMYLASVGLMFALAHILIGHPVAIAVFITVYVVRLWYFMPSYTDDYNLLEYAVLEAPEAWYGWHVRALKRFQMGSIREALNMWVMCKMLSPKEFKILMNIGVVLKLIKKPAEAEGFFREAEKNIIPGQEKQSEQILIDARAGRMPICT